MDFDLFVASFRGESHRPLVKTKNNVIGGKIVDRKSKPMSRIAVEVALANTNKAPNMSRKRKGTALYPFPAFDKCDSLLFFPSSFSSFLNSGDISNLARLMKTRIDMDCKVHLCGMIMGIPQMIRVFECMNDLHPDNISCVHTTNVVGNQIRAVMYSKYTESKTLRASLSQTYPDKEIFQLCASATVDPVKLNQFLATRPVSEQQPLTNLFYEHGELLIYAKTYLTLTFDETTKTITNFAMDCEYTSFTAL